MVRRPAGFRDRQRERNLPLRGELERVRQQILENLLQSFRVGDDAARQARIRRDDEAKIAAVGDVAEVAFHRIAHGSERDLLGLDCHRARFDLR